MTRRISPRSSLLLFLAILLVSCASISPFNPKAYENATSLKVESLALMEHATAPYSEHQAEVEALTTDLQKAYEYAKGLPKNEISIAQWRILLDSERNLLGGFLKRWADKGTLSQAFVDDEKKQIGDAFDAIIGLESGKIKPGDIK